ncbi:hypothetical protein RirG_084250 [Rhizophagus irregularis DAOM 197198w]|uniref:Uncharacterized protein n=1 Tax=Rhizophagus irregularis (strain DAOM 197198w) TaxID=1432141 RepID=A0A015KT26_RHIIW|nr:hypothetical protein RirG_084250 [Rhizophagus irregularis DAOM 197198w]
MAIHDAEKKRTGDGRAPAGERRAAESAQRPHRGHTAMDLAFLEAIGLVQVPGGEPCAIQCRKCRLEQAEQCCRAPPLMLHGPSWHDGPATTTDQMQLVGA